jgi:hypothetical protein
LTKKAEGIFIENHFKEIVSDKSNPILAKRFESLIANTDSIEIATENSLKKISEKKNQSLIEIKLNVNKKTAFSDYSEIKPQIISKQKLNKVFINSIYNSFLIYRKTICKTIVLS